MEEQVEFSFGEQPDQYAVIVRRDPYSGYSFQVTNTQTKKLTSNNWDLTKSSKSFIVTLLLEMAKMKRGES
jgi:hypothetical protein